MRRKARRVPVPGPGSGDDASRGLFPCFMLPAKARGARERLQGASLAGSSSTSWSVTPRSRVRSTEWMGTHRAEIHGELACRPARQGTLRRRSPVTSQAKRQPISLAAGAASAASDGFRIQDPFPCSRTTCDPDGPALHQAGNLTRSKGAPAHFFQRSAAGSRSWMFCSPRAKDHRCTAECPSVRVTSSGRAT